MNRWIEISHKLNDVKDILVQKRFAVTLQAYGMKNWKAIVVVLVIVGALIGSLFLLPERDTPNPGVNPSAGTNR